MPVDKKAGTAAGLFLSFAGLYTAGAALSLYGGDSGELIGSASALGISHAPGYALHALLGKAATVLIPWAGEALRVNLLSAGLSAGTVALIFLALFNFTKNIFPSVAGAVLYGLFPIVWDQAQTAEVFALNNFCLGLLFFIVSGLSDAPPEAARRRLCLMGFVGGAALANHHTIILAGPGLFLLCGAAMGRRRFVPLLPWVFVGGILGFSLNLFLFFRAAGHPPINFGDPHTWPRFWAVLTRREFGSLSLHPAALPFRTLDTTLQELRAFWRLQEHLLGACAVLAGLVGLWVQPRRFAWLGTWILTGPVFFLFSHLSPFNTLAQWRMERFQILPAFVIAFGMGLLLNFLWDRKFRALVLATVCLLAGEQAMRERPWFRWNAAFHDFGRNLAAQIPPRSLLLIDSVLFDEPTSCLINHTIVENQRPDARLIYRPGTLFELFYGEDFLELPREERPARQQEREAELWKNPPAALSVMALVRDRLPPFAFQFQGLLYQKDVPAPPPEIFIRRDFVQPPPRDYPTRLILVHYSYFAAKEALERNDAARLAALLPLVRAAGRGMEWLECNIGSLLSQSFAKSASPAVLENAKLAFLRAVSADPYFPQGPFGLGYVYLSEKNYSDAVLNFRRAAQLNPQWPEAVYMLGVANSLAGREAEARQAFNRLLAMDPGSPLAAQAARALSNQ